ncbi:MAG: aminoglycoside phosphotransferase family protein [Myxococcales bacterium]|nr:aminoglycoside phosphotransferase family protein [Myxococcales bacterium]
MTNDEAIVETCALARELGLTGASPRVIADRSNLVVHLSPHPVVARVAMATSATRVGIEWLRREVDVTRHLDGHGVPVTRPSAVVEAGPYERDGLVISFWELEALVDAPLDAEAAGRRFADAHRALVGAPIELPEWGAWTEARSVLERAKVSGAWTEEERARVERAFERGERVVESARARSASFQPVHGDAHLGNVLTTARGPVWTDWEDAFIGPVEWDLATLTSRRTLFGEERDVVEALLRGYHGPWDRELAQDLGLCRNLQVIPWLAIFAERDPSLLARMRARLEKLPTARRYRDP